MLKELNYQVNAVRELVDKAIRLLNTRGGSNGI